MPEATVEETERVLTHHTREIAEWVLSNKKQFSLGDRFQIIVGWPLSVRKTGRQVIKTGGDLDKLASIAQGMTEIVPMSALPDQAEQIMAGQVRGRIIVDPNA